jgi:hypothetical protein
MSPICRAKIQMMPEFRILMFYAGQTYQLKTLDWYNFGAAC